jgi:hypothetical protein
VVTLLAACTTDPAKQEDQVKALEPQALAAAQERAVTDLNCGAAKGQILSSDHGDLGNAYGLRSVNFRVQVTGCGLRTTYAVRCVVHSMCGAMSEGATVERVP